MSSLQHRVRSNDAAREEILRDRKAAIESERGLWGRGEVVSSGGCYCGSGSGLCEEREEGGKLVMVVGGEKAGVGGEVEREECGRGNGGGRGMFLMGWLAFALMVLTMGIIYKRCNGGYGDEAEVMLVPT
ncbi:hypothetical protein Acr_26g0006290 [Actinidia rufa]|uniref:Uncharacterized protein n=1 Tax=Actinidia rufa TaxID=165716 RepID=A0A7J0H2T0_9ERIC|nr:hypothetical protein Acr_26g0006290 [Actinidia rufa]